jgi:hypothetical protein
MVENMSPEAPSNVDKLMGTFISHFKLHLKKPYDSKEPNNRIYRGDGEPAVEIIPSALLSECSKAALTDNDLNESYKLILNHHILHGSFSENLMKKIPVLN